MNSCIILCLVFYAASNRCVLLETSADFVII